MAGYFFFIIHKLRKGDGFNLKFVVLAIILFFSFILPNLPVVISPFTPKIKGKVTDYVTQQPMANCNVIASWETRTIAFPEWGRNNVYHQFITKTDANGEYQIPRYMKPLTWIDIGYFKNWFGGIHIVAYTHGYDIGASGIDEQGKKTSFDMRLSQTNPAYVDHTISTLMTVFDSKNFYKRKIRSSLQPSYDDISQEDKQYILDECKIFEVKLRKLVQSYKGRDKALGRNYEIFGEDYSAKDVREEDSQLFKKLRREGKL